MSRSDGGRRRGQPLSAPTEHALDNGLRILVESADAPVAAVHLWIECGSVDEGADESGLAHFLEHMVFKGTSEHGIGGSAAAIEALGGELEAFTSEDQTEFEATVEAGGWAEALAVLADLVRTPRIDPVELAREIPVVIEEMRADLDDPSAMAAEQLEAILFPGHPYARPIVGTPDSVARFTAERTRAFWRRGWGAGRAWLAVVGPVDAAAVLAAASRLFGTWDTGAPRDAIREPAALASSAGRVAATRRPLETTALEIGWRLPDFAHPDSVPLDVAAALLGHGTGALLPVRLQLDEGLAAGVWSDATWRIRGSRLSCGWIPTAEDAAESLVAALEEIEGVARGSTSGRLFAQARDLLAADLLFAHETVEGRAADLLWHRVRAGRMDGAEQWRRAVAATTPDEVRGAVARWLQPEQAGVAAVGPEVRPKPLAAALRPVARPARRAASDHVAGNGLRIRIAPDEGPVAAVRILGRGGGWLETPRTAGSTRAWARLVTSGAGGLDATGFAETADGLGAVVEATTTRSTSGISASFPAEHLLDGIDLLADVLLRPAFDAEAWERVQGELQEEVETLPDEPEELAWDQIWSGLWPGHPWRLPAGGTVASLTAITPRRIRDIHGTWARAENLVVAVAGGCDPDAVAAALLPIAEGLAAGRPEGRPGLVGSAPAHGNRETRAGQAQAHVLAAVRTPGLDSPERAALELGTAILTAQAGRLFVALREVRSLAYSVAAEWVGEDGGGVFAAGLATAPARADEAAAALRAELERFADEGPTDTEVDRARRQMLGFLAAGLQRASSRAGDLAWGSVFGLPTGLAAHRTAIEAVDGRRVREVFAALSIRAPLQVLVRPR